MSAKNDQDKAPSKTRMGRTRDREAKLARELVKELLEQGRLARPARTKEDERLGGTSWSVHE